MMYSFGPVRLLCTSMLMLYFDAFVRRDDVHLQSPPLRVTFHFFAKYSTWK
jgi:hypothetical protein